MPTQILETQMAAEVPQIAAEEDRQALNEEDRQALNEITRRIIGAAQNVSSVLGPGFLEKVYENALRIELGKRGLKAEQQEPLVIRYDQQIVGTYVTDLLVEGKVLLELKAVSGLERAHSLQCVHYLKATGLRIGLLINFGRGHLEVERVVNRF